MWQLRPGILTNVAALSPAAPAGTGTLNPSDKGANITLSNGNLTATGGAASSFQSIRSQTSRSTGKYYWEWTVGQKGINNGVAGFLNSTASLATYIGADANGIGLVTNGQVVQSASFTSYLSTIANGDVCGLAIDLDAHLLWVRDGAGNWNGSGTANPATGSGGISLPSGLNSGSVFAGISVFNSSDFSTANFGGSAFSQTVPAGFSAWG